MRILKIAFSHVPTPVYGREERSPDGFLLMLLITRCASVLPLQCHFAPPRISRYRAIVVRAYVLFPSVSLHVVLRWDSAAVPQAVCVSDPGSGVSRSLIIVSSILYPALWPIYGSPLYAHITRLSLPLLPTLHTNTFHETHTPSPPHISTHPLYTHPMHTHTQIQQPDKYG